jgi:DNA sulfur modification protein DndE
MIETIRLSEKAKIQLITLKRRTGLQHWNVMCRWAFCLSLAETSKPPSEEIPSDSSIEMSWRTFAGNHDEVYRALLLTRATQDGIALERNVLLHYFRLHLHRGISYLFSGRVNSIGDMVALASRGRGKAKHAA